MKQSVGTIYIPVSTHPWKKRSEETVPEGSTPSGKNASVGDVVRFSSNPPSDAQNRPESPFTKSFHLWPDLSKRH